jgi:cell division protein FtsQ
MTGGPSAPATLEGGDARPGAGSSSPGRAPGRGGARGQRHWKAAFFGLAAVAIVAGVGWALLGSRFFVVRSVQVTVTGPGLTRAQVLTAAGIKLGLPLLRLDDAAVAHRVERLTQVESAHVSTDWPDGVSITVRARTPVFAVSGPQGYLLVDRFGVTLRQAGRRPGLPVLTMTALAGQAAPLRGNPAVTAAAAVLTELPSKVAHRVAQVSADGPGNVSVKLGNGVTIVWGDPSRASQKADELLLLMRHPARLYDVSSPATAVTKG